MKYNLLALIDTKDAVLTFGMTRVLKATIQMETTTTTVGGRAFLRMEEQDHALFSKTKMFQQAAMDLTNRLLGSLQQFQVELRKLIYPHIQLLKAVQDYYDKHSMQEKKRKLQSQLYTVDEDPAESLQQKLDGMKNDILRISDRLAVHLRDIPEQDTDEFIGWAMQKDSLLQDLADLAISA